MTSTSAFDPTRRQALRGAAMLGGLSLLAAGAAPPAAVAGGIAAPPIITTAQWGAKAARQSLTTKNYRPTFLVIHHMDSTNVTDYSRDAAVRIARQVQSWHFANGWADSGQQFSISRGGYVLEGRHGSVAALAGGKSFVLGSHVGGHNSEAVGIECEGRYNSQVPTQQLYSSLVHLSARICQQYGISTDRIVPHSRFSSTDCCGTAFKAKLDLLRSDVEATLARGTLRVSNIGAAAPAPSTGTYPTLRSGDRGEAVTRLQNLLAARGYSPGTIDGSFGPNTDRAVRSFQSAIGTGVDGVVGPKTWGALEARAASGATLANGSTGADVTALQKALNATRGANLTVDGRFGPATDQAVRGYQSSRSLSVDGRVGPSTWNALKNGR